MADNLIRIRLVQRPSPRDLEYFALHYFRLRGVYDVPLELANDLIQFGYAVVEDSSSPVTDITLSNIP